MFQPDRTEERSTWLVPGNLVKETDVQGASNLRKTSELWIFAYWFPYRLPLKFLHVLQCWKYGSARGHVGSGGSCKNTVGYTSPEFLVHLVLQTKRFLQVGALTTASGVLFFSET